MFLSVAFYFCFVSISVSAFAHFFHVSLCLSVSLFLLLLFYCTAENLNSEERISGLNGKLHRCLPFFFLFSFVNPKSRLSPAGFLSSLPSLRAHQSAAAGAKGERQFHDLTFPLLKNLYRNGVKIRRQTNEAQRVEKSRKTK